MVAAAFEGEAQGGAEVGGQGHALLGLFAGRHGDGDYVKSPQDAEGLVARALGLGLDPGVQVVEEEWGRHVQHGHDDGLGQVGQHAPEDGEGGGGLLVQPPEGGAGQLLEIIGEGEGGCGGGHGGRRRTVEAVAVVNRCLEQDVVKQVSHRLGGPDLLLANLDLDLAQVECPERDSQQSNEQLLLAS